MSMAALLNRLQWMATSLSAGTIGRGSYRKLRLPSTYRSGSFSGASASAALVSSSPGLEVIEIARILSELIKSERITLLHFVPSMLGMFLQEEGVESCATAWTTGYL